MFRRPLILLLVAAAVAAGAVVLSDGGPVGDRRVPSGSREATVTRVVDGDTAILRGIGRSRFIGVDTPEVFGGRECFGPEASAFVKGILTGRRVRYAIGAEPRDRYGRALVYIWLQDGRFLNELLVARGYARPLAIAPNVRYAERFEQRAHEAREGRRGLWSPGACS
jgi:micrococcal nuclease